MARAMVVETPRFACVFRVCRSCVAWASLAVCQTRRTNANCKRAGMLAAEVEKAEDLRRLVGVRVLRVVVVVSLAALPRRHLAARDRSLALARGSDPSTGSSRDFPIDGSRCEPLLLGGDHVDHARHKSSNEMVAHCPRGHLLCGDVPFL